MITLCFFVYYVYTKYCNSKTTIEQLNKPKKGHKKLVMQIRGLLLFVIHKIISTVFPQAMMSLKIKKGGGIHRKEYTK